MANRSSFGPMVLVVAAMSCSFYVACGDDDVIIGNGGSAGVGGTAGRGGAGGTASGGAGAGGTASGGAGAGGTASGGAGAGGTAAGTGGTGDEPDSGVVDAGPDAADGGESTND